MNHLRNTTQATSTSLIDSTKPVPLSAPSDQQFPSCYSTIAHNTCHSDAVRLLVIFCVINMVNYVDRGAIASNGVNGSPRVCTPTAVCSHSSGIQGDFDLSNFKDGVISSAFMVGLLVASPIFASLAKSFNPFRLFGLGLSVWTFAAAGCGISIDFWSITACRMLVGVGEASFISLAAPFIEDNAPVTQRSGCAHLGEFFLCSYKDLLVLQRSFDRVIEIGGT